MYFSLLIEKRSLWNSIKNFVTISRHVRHSSKIWTLFSFNLEIEVSQESHSTIKTTRIGELDKSLVNRYLERRDLFENIKCAKDQVHRVLLEPRQDHGGLSRDISNGPHKKSKYLKDQRKSEKHVFVSRRLFFLYPLLDSPRLETCADDHMN